MRLYHVTRGVVVLIALGLATAATAWAASMHAPSSASVARPLFVRATGLVSGRYGLFLVKTAFKAPPAGQSLECIGRIGALRPASGAATLGGKLPRRLDCRFGTGELTQRWTVIPGAYHLLLGSPEAPGAFDGSKSFIRRPLRLTR